MFLYHVEVMSRYFKTTRVHILKDFGDHTHTHTFDKAFVEVEDVLWLVL